MLDEPKRKGDVRNLCAVYKESLTWFQGTMRRPRGLSNIGSLSSARQPEVNFLRLDFEQTFGQIVSLRVKTLSHTNMVASRYFKEGKSSLPVDVRRSKTLLLKLPNK